jgi:hypothetical protein
MEEKESELIKFSLGENPYLIQGTKVKDKSVLKEDFFYSIVINYSQYALNSKEVGEWINPLFHKNDGYQTPIVLNPKRTEGNIDINKEKELLSRRLQSNVLEFVDKGKEEDSLRNLANGKIATTFEVEYIPDYFSIKNKDIPKENLENINFRIKKEMGEEYTNNERLCTDIIAKIYKQYIEEEIPQIVGIEEAIITYFGNIPENVRNSLFYRDIMKYICKKLKKMVRQYSIYKQFRNDHGDIENLDKLIEFIRNQNSHTAFKVKGAILHLKYYNKIYGRFNPQQRDVFSANIQDFSNLIQEIQKEEPEIKINNFMMAFPPFYKVTVLPDKNLSIKDFSSGEKQKINSLSSIVYHLINLNSVDPNDEYINYKYINLIFDEIEMYYHPEWQRTFLSELLSYLSKIQPKDMDNIKGISMIFVTHSPFILSDIPNVNIIRLNDGKLEDKETKQTFGANIYDLLTNDFFMKNGFIGKFARQKIEEVICKINSDSSIEKKDAEEIEKIIDIIGDPFYKGELKRMLLRRTDMQELGIFELEEKIKKLKENKKKENDTDTK